MWNETDEQYLQHYAKQHFYDEKSEVTKVQRSPASSFNNTGIPLYDKQQQV